MIVSGRNFIVFLIFLPFVILNANPPHNWKSHADVARQVQKKYDDMNSYRAEFQIQTSKKTMTGTAYYLKPGKIRFDFSSPAGDMLLSDGQFLWIVIKRLNVIGRQDLSLDQKDENNNRIFALMPGTVISRLFLTYHYRFDTQEQPKQIDGKDFYVLELEQKEKTGGYTNMKLYINSQSYLIEKADAVDSLDGKTTIQFRNLQPNAPLEGKLFQYSPPDTQRVVFNPLVSEE
ncbi:MAG: outer membrane lipoprotein carrier protein LolA [Leptonema sp. (in: Bacteria)]|nr:outer membrane lipoprotein carrier protein LolA [Leptonema sp. (in: bacteria)]